MPPVNVNLLALGKTPPLTKTMHLHPPAPFDIKDKDGHQLMSSIIHQAQQEGCKKSWQKVNY
eukprot:12281810-Ditylum_brightwellii.AAC.1